MRIGILGGSFNPAHAGHRAISLFALKRLALDQVWWLISPQNPLKSRKDMAPLAARLRKARTIAKHSKILVSDLETEFGTRFTADTLRKLRARFPATHFVWLMGADNLKQMPRWRRWPEIFRLVPVAVFKRPGYKIGRGIGKAAIYFAKAQQPAAYAPNLVLMPPPAWLVLDNPLNLLSSTALRSPSKRKD